MKRENSDELRITDQERTMTNRSYRLRCGEGRLRLVVSSNEDASRRTEWTIDAECKYGPTGPVVTSCAHGSTRAEALHSLRDAWSPELRRAGLTMFDWAAVESALIAVRAI